MDTNELCHRLSLNTERAHSELLLAIAAMDPIQRRRHNGLVDMGRIHKAIDGCFDLIVLAGTLDKIRSRKEHRREPYNEAKGHLECAHKLLTSARHTIEAVKPNLAVNAGDLAKIDRAIRSKLVQIESAYDAEVI